MADHAPPDIVLTNRNLNRRIDDLVSELRATDKRKAELERAIFMLPLPPQEFGDGPQERAGFAVKTITDLIATIAANSFKCGQCGERRFGAPAYIHSASGDEVESKVCRECHDMMRGEAEMEPLGGLG